MMNANKNKDTNQTEVKTKDFLESSRAPIYSN
jgi:hypothetical protein